MGNYPALIINPTTTTLCLFEQEEKTKQNSAEAEVIKLIAIIPFITKMDATIATFTKVRYYAFN